jgi:iron(III) transport system permease protein
MANSFRIQDSRLFSPFGNDGERVWGIGAVLLTALVALPVATIGALALFPTENIWPHLVRSVLPGYVWRTALLMTGVGVITFVIGTGTAWLVTMYRFPGRKWLQWALLIPLATPTYIIAYTYVDVFDYSGIVQTGLRDTFGWNSVRDYWFPEIRSLGGAIFVMSFVLYPYVFLTSRASFLKQSVCHLEVSRTLGRTAAGTFYSVALPLARPGIVVGVTLAMMECLNDIGAVEYFGVNTLTVGIYATWLGRGNLGGAAQIASVMLIFVFLLIWLERMARSRQRFHHMSLRERRPTRQKLRGWRGWVSTACCVAPIFFGFVIPGAVLLEFATSHFEEAASADYLRFTRNSLLLSAIAATAAIMIGLFLAYAHRIARSNLVQIAIRFASVGYAVPGAVLGIGILVPLAAFDNALDGMARELAGISTGLLLTGTIFSIVYAYVVRFLAISYGAIESGLGRVTPNLAAAARTLGRTPTGALREVHLPLIRPALATAGLLVFVDCMKELPATLILRPFNFDTLATHVYTYASLDLLEESALSALTIVLSGLIPVILLNRTLKEPKRESAAVAGTEYDRSGAGLLPE